ncbi:MAG: hypothetical protein AAF945_11680 [Actinomycetota bacterium]
MTDTPSEPIDPVDPVDASPDNLHRNVRKVIAAGRELGVEVVPHSYPQGAKTAQDAADAIGVEVGQIV